jgi:hypothetical protein
MIQLQRESSDRLHQLLEWLQPVCVGFQETSVKRVGSEVITTVTMKGGVLWVLCSSEKAVRFKGTYCFLLQGQRTGQTRKKQTTVCFFLVSL